MLSVRPLFFQRSLTNVFNHIWTNLIQPLNLEVKQKVANDIFITLLKYKIQTFVSKQIRKPVLQGVLKISVKKKKIDNYFLLFLHFKTHTNLAFKN